MGLKTTTAGWFPKPHAVRLARWRHAELEIDDAALAATEREATSAAIELQRSIGLDVLVDPQMSRGDMVGAFGEGIEGLEPGGLVRCWGNRYYRRPRIVDQPRWSAPLTVDGWRLAREVAEAPVRAVLTGPYTLMDWSFDEHFGSRAAACGALADVVAQEAVALAEAGADEIELSEPAAGVRPDELPMLREALERVRGALSGKAACWVRAGLGDPAVDQGALIGLPADGLFLALSAATPTALEFLKTLPGTMPLTAGVLDVHDPRVESVDEIRARVEQIGRHVPAERLWLAPDGGMQALEPAIAEAKLRAMVEAARSARGG